MPKKQKPKANTAPFMDQSDLQSSEVNIARKGEIIMELEGTKPGIKHRFRVSRSILRNASDYFSVLLDPIKFGEGIAIEAKLQELYKKSSGPLPSSSLPFIKIADCGELVQASVPTSQIFGLFLKILHDPATSWPVTRSNSINLVALLAIVADRFAAIDSLERT